MESRETIVSWKSALTVVKTLDIARYTIRQWKNSVISLNLRQNADNYSRFRHQRPFRTSKFRHERSPWKLALHDVEPTGERKIAVGSSGLRISTADFCVSPVNVDRHKSYSVWIKKILTFRICNDPRDPSLAMAHTPWQSVADVPFAILDTHRVWEHFCACVTTKNGRPTDERSARSSYIRATRQFSWLFSTFSGHCRS